MHYKIWQHLLTEEGTKDIQKFQVPFRQKTVYYFWHQEIQNKWHFSDNPFESAQEYLHNQGSEMCLEILDDVISEPGTKSLAFQVTDIMQEWAPFTQELGLDSTCIVCLFNL
jgi:hypothetical protein